MVDMSSIGARTIVDVRVWLDEDGETIYVTVPDKQKPFIDKIVCVGLSLSPPFFGERLVELLKRLAREQETELAREQHAEGDTLRGREGTNG